MKVTVTNISRVSQTVFAIEGRYGLPAGQSYTGEFTDARVDEMANHQPGKWALEVWEPAAPMWHGEPELEPEGWHLSPDFVLPEPGETIAVIDDSGEVVVVEPELPPPEPEPTPAPAPVAAKARKAKQPVRRKAK